VPVVFIPGSGGSYKQVRAIRTQYGRVLCTREARSESNSPVQVRSLASETAKQHAASPVGTILDWYALDFHEELSAFEGASQLDSSPVSPTLSRAVLCFPGALLSRQRSFLVTTLQQLDAMYTAVHKPNAPPVILVGHSMGGVLACSVAAGMPGAPLRPNHNHAMKLR